MKGSDTVRYVNDAITFERSIFTENAIFKMLPRLCRSRRYLRLEAQLRVVAGFVVPDRQTDTHTHTHTHTQMYTCAPRVNFAMTCSVSIAAVQPVTGTCT